MSVCVFSNCPSPQPGSSGRCLGCDSLLLGQSIQDRYVVWEVISRTKFAVSYLVTDSKKGDAKKIIKELQPVTEDDPDFYTVTRSTVERLFEREARVLLSLQHPGIPKLFAAFEENGYWYIVQEYIAGQTLLEWLEMNQTPLKEADARSILRELATILSYLHSRTPPVIHRDIKPQNIMRKEKEERLLLINFAAVSQVSVSSNKSGTIIGSAGYAPPEQLIGQAVAQSDLYAAGATMLRLLTGFHPSKLFDIRQRRFIWEEHTKITPSFAEVINGLLAADLIQRTSSADELIAQIDILRPLQK